MVLIVGEDLGNLKSKKEKKKIDKSKWSVVVGVRLDSFRLVQKGEVEQWVVRVVGVRVRFQSIRVCRSGRRLWFRAWFFLEFRVYLQRLVGIVIFVLGFTGVRVFGGQFFFRGDSGFFLSFVLDCVQGRFILFLYQFLIIGDIFFLFYIQKVFFLNKCVEVLKSELKKNSNRLGGLSIGQEL